MNASETTPQIPSFQELRIVFLGTPDFAVSSLRALIQAGLKVVGVVTAPDKPAGRGMKLTPSAVKSYAVDNGIPVLQPHKLKDPEFIEALKALNPDLQVVVAFRMLPEIVWNLPPLGTINVHASILPDYRGAAPINWAIINGEKQTGITTFQLKHEIDTGNILLQQTVPIDPDQTAGELHDVLKETGASLLVQTIRELCEGKIHPQPQTAIEKNQPAKHAPKIYTDTCKLNFNQPVDAVYNHIRGLAPYPGAFTQLEKKLLKIFKAKKEITVIHETAGTILSDKKSFIKIACKDGYIHFIEIQPEGKKKMQVGEFLRGYHWEK